MNRKNVIRTVTAIAVVVLLAWSFFYFSDDTRGYKPVDTSVAVAWMRARGAVPCTYTADIGQYDEPDISGVPARARLFYLTHRQITAAMAPCGR